MDGFDDGLLDGVLDLLGDGLLDWVFFRWA